MRLEELKPRFWEPPGAETFAPLTPEDVERAEAVLGVRLPRAYVELLEVQNGGFVAHEFDAFPTDTPNSWAEDHVWFRTLAGIGPSAHHASLTADPAAWRLPPGVVPFSGDGHYAITLDYRGARTEPLVAWLDTEAGQDLALAPDLLTFVEALVPLDDFDVPDDMIEIVHVRRTETGDTYCGFTLDGLSWVDEDQVPADHSEMCSLCLELIQRWREAAARRA